MKISVSKSSVVRIQALDLLGNSNLNPAFFVVRIQTLDLFGSSNLNSAAQYFFSPFWVRAEVCFFVDFVVVQHRLGPMISLFFLVE